MTEIREISLREKFASLLIKAKLGLDVRNEVVALIEERANESIPEKSTNSPKEYGEWLLSFSSPSSLFSILHSISREKKYVKKWRLPLILDRIVETMEESDGENIFSGKVLSASFFILSPSLNKRYQEKIDNPYLSPIGLFLSHSLSSFASYPYAYSFPFEAKKETINKLFTTLERLFHNASPSYSFPGATWMVKISDEKGKEYSFYGDGSLSPSSFLVPYVPYFLKIRDINEIDKVTYLSFQYSRLSKDKKEEILESFIFDRNNERINLTRHSSQMDMTLCLKDKGREIRQILDSINVYSFYPKLLEVNENLNVREEEAYFRTRYSLYYETEFKRSGRWTGFFSSSDLPASWSKLTSIIRDKIDYTHSMESLDPSLSSIPRTDEDTVYACSVVFSSPFSKEYTYIAPDDTYYPNMKVMVPVGKNNDLKIATVKSLQVFSKEKDKETIKKYKRIISHYPNKEKD